MDAALAIRTEKERIRHFMRARRRALSKDSIKERSAKICHKIESLPSFKNAKCIAGYIPFDNEVDLMPLLQQCFTKKRVVATRTVDDSLMELREITSLDDLKKGSFGILEPKSTCPLVEPNEIDLFLIPGVAFDNECNRIGFGAGYFDRLLKEVHGYKLGVAYLFQLTLSLPHDAHDVAMDRVITDAS